ncbi:hypothetical protein PFICI_14567 [Pestalotiopsis fici W106-1]|uniref:Uncharacterized protein n=1 Tax=Pestalotiopsis fici (strain W106-1 / CGMCC3.15140) TaxID=1229662 RepID=W3WLD0_PESFW|nr:uncharacterized protein PFICI_14567 [Pestalotiopsis fici W106-1]ETS73621.1 hypothetical protein PFICI_14567 [Pestalotiopsis fici W106-1]
MDIPAAALRPQGMGLLENDIRLIIFLVVDFKSIPNLALTSKAWTTTYAAHRTYIHRYCLRGVIGEENMSIAFARYAASQLTWTPSPIRGFSKSCSLEELPVKLQEFGNKYLVPGALMPSDIDHKMARGMIHFHTHVRNWSSNFGYLSRESWTDRLWDFESLALNNQEISRFENSVYILEILRLLFPVYLEDDREEDREIFTALCHFFAPWQLHIIKEIENNMIELCPDWYLSEFTDNNVVSDVSAFEAIFSSLGVEGISENRVHGVLKCQSLVEDMLRAENRQIFALTPRHEYQPPLGTLSWLFEKDTLHQIQRADIEELLSKYPEDDTGPADCWLYQQTLSVALCAKLPSPLYMISPRICDRKTLEHRFGGSFPSRSELIDNLDGAQVVDRNY